MIDKDRLAANCVRVMGHGILITGPSGSGKSDLTLRLINMASPLLDEPCRLVSDDQTMLVEKSGTLYASAPEQIAGKLEVRGVGVMSFSHVDHVPVCLIIDLVERCMIERIPDLPSSKREIMGISLPLVQLFPFEISACEKVINIVRALKTDSLANDI